MLEYKMSHAEYMEMKALAEEVFGIKDEEKLKKMAYLITMITSCENDREEIPNLSFISPKYDD